MKGARLALPLALLVLPWTGGTVAATLPAPGVVEATLDLDPAREAAHAALTLELASLPVAGRVLGPAELQHALEQGNPHVLAAAYGAARGALQAALPGGRVAEERLDAGPREPPGHPARVRYAARLDFAPAGATPVTPSVTDALLAAGARVRLDVAPAGAAAWTARLPEGYRWHASTTADVATPREARVAGPVRLVVEAAPERVRATPPDEVAFRVEVLPRDARAGGHPARVVVDANVTGLSTQGLALPPGVEAERLPLRVLPRVGLAPDAAAAGVAARVKAQLEAWVRGNFGQPAEARVETLPPDATGDALRVRATAGFLLAPAGVDAGVADTLLRAGAGLRRELRLAVLPHAVTTYEVGLPPGELAFREATHAHLAGRTRLASTFAGNGSHAQEAVLGFVLSDPRAPQSGGPAVRSRVDVALDVRDVGVRRLAFGDGGTLDVRGNVTLHVAALPVARGLLPPDVDLARLPAWALRELDAQGALPGRALAAMEEEARRAAGAALSGWARNVSVDGGWDEASLRATARDAPLVLDLAFQGNRPLLERTASAVALYRTTLAFTLEPISGGPTTYRVALPPGLALERVEAPSAHVTRGWDGRDWVEVALGEDAGPTPVTMTMAVEPEFVARHVPVAAGVVAATLSVVVLGAVTAWLRRRR